MRRFLLPMAWLFSAGTLQANDVSSIHQAIEHAALNNPSILASWNAFEAANQGVRVAQGGYYPSVDLNGEIGSERIEDTNNFKDTYDTSSMRFTITQMLFDGFATKHEVAKQGFIKLARYYDFKQASEEVALETAQAYLDVQRYRKLVNLAQENLDQHRSYHRDIEERVNSGVGRGVDLEQASARLALAESNLLTEMTNLHDVSTRFYRLVGLFPADNIQAVDITKSLIPANRTEALEQAFSSNPQLNASIENIRASQAETRVRNSPMMPRFDLRFRKQIDDNDRGISGQYDEEAIELVMTYNLYRGGSDKARKRQASYLFFEAMESRERICRDVRQTVSIAYNDIESQQRLIGFLERNAKSISKARSAYKKQFDIGQRTLLDLLDTENEYFEVRRTLTNAKSELDLAYVRTLAGMGLLLNALDINGVDQDTLEELNFDRSDDFSAKCPAQAPKMGHVGFNNYDELNNHNTVAKKKQLDSVTSSRPNQGGKLVNLDVKFDLESTAVPSKAKQDIRKAADILCKNPNTKGLVEGHTDSTGSESYNLALSEARAESVLNDLNARCQTVPGQLKTVAYGELKPIADNSTAEGRRKNRRVELIIPKK